MTPFFTVYACAVFALILIIPHFANAQINMTQMSPQDIKRSICQHQQAQLEWEKGLAIVKGNNIIISPPASLTPIYFNMTQWKGQFDFYNKECALITMNVQP